MEYDQFTSPNGQSLLLADPEPTPPKFVLSKLRSHFWLSTSQFIRLLMIPCVVLFLPVSIIGLFTKNGSGPGFFIGVVLFILAGIYSIRVSRRRSQREIARRDQLIADLRAPYLPARLEQVTEALREAGTLAEQLKRELDARTALLTEIKDKVAATTAQAADLEKLAKVDDDTTRALNRYFDGALKDRLDELEKSARRREWLLGTVGAISFGIITILLSHFIFGFLYGHTTATSFPPTAALSALRQVAPPLGGKVLGGPVRPRTVRYDGLDLDLTVRASLADAD